MLQYTYKLLVFIVYQKGVKCSCLECSWCLEPRRPTKLLVPSCETSRRYQTRVGKFSLGDSNREWPTARARPLSVIVEATTDEPVWAHKH